MLVEFYPYFAPILDALSVALAPSLANPNLFGLLYFILINALALHAMYDDKQRAIIGAPRMPEFELLVLSLIGGAIGATYDQQHYRHKTRKEPFATWLAVWFTLWLGLLLAGFAWLWVHRGH